jgi:hypothetical protein
VRKRVLVALERRPVVSGAVITCGWVGMTLALAELPPDPFWGPVYVNGVGYGRWTLTRLPRDDVATQAPAFTL